ncbi:unnamed protein product [Mytilus coruscus]|uniref:Uncharacterized protein n=1 Tax=Mytilus coruscus TaxID=42192 RepID=A0A6J8AQL0_MYTCO|nr:unnamed protein product [Mytilus coruscus]
MREKIDMEETDLKLIFLPVINERTEGTAKSKQRSVISNETGPTTNMAENGKEKRINENLVKKSQKSTKSKNDKEETITAKKTRILNLENEIKHMKSVLDTFTRREETQQNVQAQHLITDNIHVGPNSNVHNTYMYQKLQNKMKETHLENRLKIMENQMIQNMCIQTALTTQMALQNRHSISHHHGFYQGLPGNSHYIQPNVMQTYMHAPHYAFHNMHIPTQPVLNLMRMPPNPMHMPPNPIHMTTNPMNIPPNPMHNFMQMPFNTVHNFMQIPANPIHNFIQIPPNSMHNIQMPPNTMHNFRYMLQHMIIEQNMEQQGRICILTKAIMALKYNKI